MGGKNKGGSKHQKPETSDVATKNTEEDMKSKELANSVTHLKNLSVIEGSDKKDSEKKQEKKVNDTPPGVGLAGKPIDLSGKEKSRDEIKAERERKKLEKKMKKDTVKVVNPISDSGPKQPKKEQQNSNKQNDKKQEKSTGNQNQNKENKSAIKQKTGKSALKSNSPEYDKSNLQVRFDLQPINTTNIKETAKPGYAFIPANSFNVHPAFRILAAKCERNKITGINDLLREFYDTLILYLKSFSIEEGESYKIILSENIQPQFSCLSSNGRRPFPLAIGNLIRQFRKLLTTYKEEDSEKKMRSELIDWLEQSKYVNFELAEQAISEFSLEKLKIPGEKNIMTYGRCPIVERILLDAKKENLNIHVYVIDNPNVNTGKELLENLSEAGIPCTYGHINSVGYLMEHCNYVLMGSSAILSNGRAVASRGSSILALLANSLNIPVLIAAKTCTFVDKVRLDEHLSTALLKEPLETIPEDLVTALVTDFRILPPTSAPAVLKAKKLGCD